MPFTAGAVPKRHTPVTLLVPNHLYQEWQQAALDSGHTIDTYLISTITIATRLKLLEGTQRIPRQGSAIDPLLAEAIRVNSRGTTWEHKADLLLATPGLTAEKPLPEQPDPASPTTTLTHTAQQLMARHGLPVRQPQNYSPYSLIGGHRFTWRQTSHILAIWEHAEAAWTGKRVADLGTAAGLPNRGVEPTLRQLIDGGHLESRPHPAPVSGGWYRTAKNQHRLSPALIIALTAGDVKPA